MAYMLDLRAEGLPSIFLIRLAIAIGELACSVCGHASGLLATESTTSPHRLNHFGQITLITAYFWICLGWKARSSNGF